MVREKLRSFVVENLMLGMDGNSLADDASLMDSGILDSVGVLDLVGFLEESWSFPVADEELVRENLDSINALVQFVERKVA